MAKIQPGENPARPGERLATEVQEGGRNVAREVGQEVSRQAEHARGQVRDLADQAQHRVEEQADRGLASLAHRVSALAAALDAAARQLDDAEEQSLAASCRDVRDRIDRMGSYLENNDVRGLIDDLEDAGRHNPTVFMGSTFAAGLALGRFLRASEPRSSTTRGARTYAGPEDPIVNRSRVQDPAAFPARTEPVDITPPREVPS